METPLKLIICLQILGILPAPPPPLSIVYNPAIYIIYNKFSFKFSDGLDTLFIKSGKHIQGKSS